MGAFDLNIVSELEGSAVFVNVIFKGACENAHLHQTFAVVAEAVEPAALFEEHMAGVAACAEEAAAFGSDLEGGVGIRKTGYDGFVKIGYEALAAAAEGAVRNEAHGAAAGVTGILLADYGYENILFHGGILLSQGGGELVINPRQDMPGALKA